MRASLLIVVLTLGACGAQPEVPPDGRPDAGTPGGSDAGTSDGGAPQGTDGGADAGLSAPRDGGADASVAVAPDASVDGGPDASVDGGPDASVDAGAVSAPDAGRPVPDGGTWRNSLSVCWTDASCTRALAVAHGGSWTSSIPYNSNAALAAAYAEGLDGVKIDVRVTSDNVPVIAHSSPIEWFESIDCYNKRIENMTAAQVVQCHRVPSTSETFQRLDDVLASLRGKMVVQLCVKRDVDYARTVEAIRAAHAEDFAFIELGSPSHLQTIVPTIPNGNTVWYMVNVASNLAEVDTLLNVINNPRAFLYEFDPTVDARALATRLHAAGIRTFTYDSSQLATVQTFKGYFENGYDVVSANAVGNLMSARTQVNQARGVTPP